MDFVNGMVTNIELPGSLSVNGKNMMRALASILQIDTEEHEIKTWSKNEVCNIKYQATKLMAFVYREAYMDNVKSSTPS